MAPSEASTRLADMDTTKKLLAAAGIAVATVLTWFAWLGWDTKYDYDPITGHGTGPYEVWQVAGCVLCLAAIAAVGGLLLRPWVVMVAMTLSFTTPFTLQAARIDDSGLFAVGAIMVLIGMAAGSLAVAAVAGAVRDRRRGGPAVTATPR
jgi:hypothetical protein